MKNKLKKSNIMILAALAALWLSACDKSKSESSPPLPPEAPQNLAATDGTYGNQVQLSWDASTGAQSYKVYKAIDSVNGEYRLVTSGVAGTQWADTTVTVSRMYYYAVMAVNTGGTSPMSGADLGYAGELAPEPPSPPAGLVATGSYLHHVYLQWDQADGADRYHVYRSDSINGTYTNITDDDGLTTAELDGIDVDGTDYSFDDESTAEGKAYYYKVSAENEDGEGLSSDPVMGWFPYDAPDTAPAGVAATDGTYSNKVAISWDAVTEADTYSVFRSLSAYPSTDCPASTETSSYASIGATSSLSFDDTELAADDYNVYCYAVKAVNASGASVLSDPDKGNKSSSGVAVPASPFDLDATTDE
ncbi:MAG TPA: hypothetical protein PK573_04840, partial [Spirochaetota bacterium]|nr:hypothetical protein [Spirochaetota bacterium]